MQKKYFTVKPSKMKNILILLALALPIIALSQKCDFREDYSNSNNWTIQDLNPAGTAQIPQRIVINGGTLNFVNTPDGLNTTRAFRNIGNNLCDSWVADFIFTPTQISTANRSAGHIIFAATAGNQAPLRTAPPLTFTNQDGLGVFFVSVNNRWDLRLEPFIKDNNQWVPSRPNCSIVLDGRQTLNTTYLIRFERIDPSNGRMTVIRQNNNQIVGQCCFPIPNTIQNLNFFQHANGTGGDLSRSISANVDSLCVKNCFTIDNCCNPNQIIGDNLICPATEIPRIYSVLNDPSATYTWIIPPGITFIGQGTNNITVTDWGNVTGNIQIQVVIECACQTNTLVKNVQIIEDLIPYTSFNYTASANGNIITNLTLTPFLPAPAGAIHWWNIYEADNCLPNNFLALGENTSSGSTPLRNASFNSVFTVISPSGSFPNIETGKCYIIKHGLYYPNEICPWVEKRGKILISSSLRSEKPEVKLILEEVNELKENRR